MDNQNPRLADALGLLVRFYLLPGHRFETFGVAPPIKDIQFGAMLADRANDAKWIIEDINKRGRKIAVS